MSLILTATDGSEPATRAVAAAAGFAKASGAKLLIMTVGHDLTTDEMAQSKRQGIAPGDLLERFARETLSSARACAERAGAKDIDVIDCMGDAARAILDLAESEHADMVVVGRRGRGRLAGLVLGSVSQRLATNASCPVVVVP